jgi:hypothetical protein
MNEPSWSTFLPWVVALTFIFVSSLGCLLTVLFAARWVLRAYQSGPGLVGRVEGLENRVEEGLQILDAGIAEAKALADKRIRREAARDRRASSTKGGADEGPDLSDPMVQRALALGAGSSPSLPAAPDNGTGRKAALRRMASGR